MPVFTPPTISDMPAVLPETHGAQRSLFRYFGDNPRGLSVVFVNGHYTTVDSPYAGDLETLTDGVTYFLGGHVYHVDAAIAALLVADGYTTTADPTPPSRNLPWGALAGLTWSQFRDDYGTWG